MLTEASSLQWLLVNFSPLFTEPSFGNFVALASGWLLCTGRRTISRVIQVSDLGDEARRHHSSLYRFFSRAVWDSDRLGACVFQLVLELLPADAGIVLTVDDTLCRKGGAHIWGGGMHHDALLSTYGGVSKALKLFSFGHNWVILNVCIPLPWNAKRAIAIPIGFRLYRSKKRCPPTQYRKRTELARELAEQAAARVPAERRITLVGDTEYACREVVRDLPERVKFVGPMNMGAALYDPPPAKGVYRGRPRKKGKRIRSPRQLIADKRTRWIRRTVVIYGREVEVLVKTQACLWYTVAGGRLVRMIVTRDPKGRIEDRAYFATDAEMGVAAIAQRFALRWTQEEMHRNVKQHLGLEDPQNGWWRRPRGQRRNKKTPGPQPHKHRGSRAVSRTVPFILTTYAIVVLWYLANGNPRSDVARVRRRAPWYRDKTEPSFGDMLAALRRRLWAEQIFSDPGAGQGAAKIDAALIEWLCAA
jgi:hypothetical protein